MAHVAGVRTPHRTGVFEIRRRAGLYGVLSGVTGLLATGFLWLATVGGEAWLWVPAVIMGGLFALVVPGVLDAGVPLLVADRHGIRMRDDEGTWVGLLWPDVVEAEVVAQEGWRDPYVRVTAGDGHQEYRAPVGPATTASADEAETALASYREAAAY